MTANKEQYPSIVVGVISFVAFLYVTFGLYCFSIWGNDIKPLVTDNVFTDEIAPTWLSYLIIVLFCI